MSMMKVNVLSLCDSVRPSLSSACRLFNSNLSDGSVFDLGCGAERSIHSQVDGNTSLRSWRLAGQKQVRETGQMSRYTHTHKLTTSLSSCVCSNSSECQADGKCAVGLMCVFVPSSCQKEWVEVKPGSQLGWTIPPTFTGPRLNVQRWIQVG